MKAGGVETERRSWSQRPFAHGYEGEGPGADVARIEPLDARLGDYGYT